MRPEAVVAGYSQSPDSVKRTVEALTKSLTQIDREIGFDQIVITSKTGPYLGIEPLNGQLVVSLVKGLVFWKEASVLLRTDPQITGDTELGKRVAIIDSFTYPENARDIVTSLAKDGYEPVAFLSLCCLNEKVEEELEKSRKEAGLGSLRYYPPSETIPDPFGILTNLPFD